MIRLPTSRGLRRAAHVLALLPLLAGATACQELGEANIVTPQFGSSGTADISRIAVYRDGPPSLTIAWAMAWIGPQGGSLRILDFEVIVPPNAVSKVTRFAIRLPVDPGIADHALAEFEPHNVQFAQPVTLRLPYRGTSAESSTSSILWWNGAVWVRYPTIVLPDGRLETTTTHFSEYGTEEPQRGITPVGG
jgi:hypothetical protein